MPLFAATAYLLVAAVACCAVLLPLPLAAAQEHSQITNVKDLEAAIYTEAAFAPKGSADACVRLLHARGAAGCATPGRGPAEGRLQRLDALLPSADDYPGGLFLIMMMLRCCAAGWTRREAACLGKVCKCAPALIQSNPLSPATARLLSRRRNRLCAAARAAARLPAAGGRQPRAGGARARGAGGADAGASARLLPGRSSATG